jgi:CubicO group peptidase (beta-lactamase class C family)
VLAELIERVAGEDYRDVIERRVTTPMGLPRVLGVPPGAQAGIAELVAVGEPATAEEIEAVLGVPGIDVGEVTSDNLLRFNEPEARAVGHPGGGGIMTAAQLATFYQHLLHDDGRLFDPTVLHDVRTNVRNRLPDPMLGHPANRTLGLQLAGDDGHANKRGFGATSSPLAFGHAGAYGQIGWADPATGLSFAYCTNGMDLHQIREARRMVGLSSRAALCATPAVA